MRTIQGTATTVHACLLSTLLLYLTTNGEGLDCELRIKVRQHTAYMARREANLTIECLVEFCESFPTLISWFKFNPNNSAPVNSTSRVSIKLKNYNNKTAMSYLTFLNLVEADAGLYRCQSGAEKGHWINVTVSESDEVTTVAYKNQTTNSNVKVVSQLEFYLYSALGIFICVVMVISLSIVSICGCKGKPRKPAERENQNIAIPMEPNPQPAHDPYSLCLYNNPAVLEPTAIQRASPEANDGMHGNSRRGKKERKRGKGGGGREGGENEFPVLYASLNHRTLPERPTRPQKETTEYAAIRVT